MASWLRLWHDMPNDPKWRTISRLSGQSIALVQSVYIHLLVSASQNVTKGHDEVTRGHIDVTHEDLASALDVTESDISSVLDAMQGRVLEGDLISGWEVRQPKREDQGNEKTGAKSAAERKREERQRKRVLQNNSGFVSCHDGSRSVTHTEVDPDTDINNKTLLSHGEKNATGPSENNSPSNLEPAPQETEAKNKRHEYSPEFEAAWLIYPRRPGSPDKHGALKAWNARLRDGVTADAMLEGVRRYAAFVKATGKTGTEFIKQAKTFFGPSQHFDDEWQVSTGENHVEFRFNQSDPRPYSEQYLSWEQQRVTGMEPMGSHDQNLREPLDCEEWQSPVRTVGTSD
ncbi:phage replisome organizer [Yersinia bercovieri]|uniref:phage replisome organizer n=1 Tax=Yersinia bercovieri TaxID=634 RepID=UPI003B973C8E